MLYLQRVTRNTNLIRLLFALLAVLYLHCNFNTKVWVVSTNQENLLGLYNITILQY